ncbi:oxaloacetate decarboxylase subunit gamma [Thalassotalea litorea]|uniref:Probable oxaloacetate decarboxylase gamma chain n=1 Tax=Thalassotalea litorea TaxID=2020715 RepID=A0A5R9IH83_9GAMM|nr:OadG family transporter subunit [Thalassotalea litorea]TLU64894.1 oxaloacetate decarboxylase subunit gamma [Thalassotalea litorea]
MENIAETFIEAGTLMVVGMVFVFAFLSLLIVAIKVLAKIATNFPDAKVPEKLPRQISSNTTREGEVPATVVAAISSAISQYRKNKITK